MNKHILALAVLLLGFGFCQAKILDVRSFGAVGDGKSIDSDAIDRAIAEASRHKGDTVFLPEGRYSCYSIHLKSNVTLKLDKNATILAAAPRDDKGYDQPEHNPDSLYQDFGHSHWHNSLMWGENLENITICGEGLIDGTGVLTRGTGRIALLKLLLPTRLLP